MAEVPETTQRRRRHLRTGVIIGGVAWLLTGIYAVRTNEHVVIRRLGRALKAPVASGLHCCFPWPIDRRTRVRMDEPRRVIVGATAADQTVGTTPSPSLSRFLSGDENVVQVQMVVQYSVSAAEPVRFLFHSQDPRKLVQVAAQRALTNVLAGVEVDDVLAHEKAAIAIKVTEQTQVVLDRLESGVTVISVTIPSVEPPMEVARDFQDVASAREDYHRFMNEADAYAAEVIPQANGEAARLISGAEGYKLKVVNEAQGDASYFNDLRHEYARAKEVTSARIYIETMERLLPKMRVVLADEGESGAIDLSIVRNEP
ncbi:MAG TPA: FtsH protease activity modulator HflK [Armatimonadota bacterium]|nr:FtsH protease activity modulator HflK [Armatimonadota bacterium]